MDTTSILLAVVGAAAGGAGAWFAAKSRFGREADALRAQVDAAEKARQQATQLWQQARREVEQLQKDMLARGVIGKPGATPAPAAKQPTAADLEAERRARLAAAEAALSKVAGDNPPSVLPHGFADTQPMTSPGRL